MQHIFQTFNLKLLKMCFDNSRSITCSLYKVTQVYVYLLKFETDQIHLLLFFDFWQRFKPAETVIRSSNFIHKYLSFIINANKQVHGFNIFSYILSRQSKTIFLRLYSCEWLMHSFSLWILAYFNCVFYILLKYETAEAYDDFGYM